MDERAYLDWNATAPLRPEARAALVAALETVGNASSVHAQGRAARQCVEEARAEVAALVGATPRHVVFTSGGTEANVLALAPGLAEPEGRPVTRLLIGATEHASVRAGGRFPPEAVAEVRVDSEGVIDLDHLAAQLERVRREDGRALVALMAANNETGALHPVRAAAEIVHAAGGLLHVDAVQAAGRIPLDIGDLQADFLSLSAHKIGGPQGVGALVRRAETPLVPLMRGGSQERGLRAGTENVAGIAAFAAAARAARAGQAAEAAQARRLREKLEAGLMALAPQTVIFSAGAERVPNTTLFAVPGIRAETALIALDLAGVAVSSGSACSSGKVGPSHVLAAMGVPPALAAGAIRVSSGYATGEEEVECLLKAWRKCIAALGKSRQEIAA